MSSCFEWGDYSIVSWSPDGGENIIHPWGVETADSDGFFSLDRTSGYRYRVVSESQQTAVNLKQTYQHISMKDGEWSLETSDKVEEKAILRQAQLIAVTDSWHMDFVMRFRFRKDQFEWAEIAGQQIIHTNSNVYHQYPVRQVKLCGKDHSVSISLVDFITTANFTPEMYVRDRGDEWIVHVRMMPTSSSKKIIKMCNRYMKTKSLPSCLSQLILSIPMLHKSLWYRGEQNPYQSKLMRVLNPNAFALGLLRKAEVLSLKVQCTWT